MRSIGAARSAPGFSSRRSGRHERWHPSHPSHLVRRGVPSTTVIVPAIEIDRGERASGLSTSTALADATD
jgi:hypothetical protein